MSLFVKASHGRFHDILPKEYSGIFPELLWGKMICYKLRCLLTMRVSQILSLTRLIPDIKSILCQKGFSQHMIGSQSEIIMSMNLMVCLKDNVFFDKLF